jgi:hypothetical protein
MKGILKFKLPEEAEEFATAQNAGKYFSALWELDNWLRSKLKYEPLNQDQIDTYTEARKALHQKLAEAGVSLYGD